MAEIDPTDRPVLVVEGGPNDGETVPLRGRITLGRQGSNDVVVTDLGVSRNHAALFQEEDRFFLSDLSSSNGTFVNRKNVGSEAYPLKDGDRIQLGASETTFVFQSGAASTVGITLPVRAEGVVGRAPNATVAIQLPGNVLPEAPPEPAEDEEIYEGTVLLNVRVEGSLGLVITLTQQLRENPEFRLMRLSNNRSGGVDIWLGLRQPLSLIIVLAKLDGVEDVAPIQGAGSGANGDEPALGVSLRG